MVKHFYSIFMWLQHIIYYVSSNWLENLRNKLWRLTIPLYIEVLYSRERHKGVNWVSRREFRSIRDRKRSKQKQKVTKVVLLFLAVMLVITGVRYFTKPLAVPAMAVAAQEDNGGGFLSQAVYLRMLSQVIPGFEPVAVPDSAEGEAALEEQTKKINALADPKLLMSSQIPFMVDALVSQPQVDNVPVRQEDTNDATQPKIVIPLRHTVSGDGEVIIYHAHGTESFVPTSGKNFTDNLTMTVAQLGEELADLLQSQYNIPVIHNNKIHDLPRSGAYEKARPTIARLLEENLSTDLVIDLHRDGVDRDISTVKLDGDSVGKILFIVGTRHPDWKENKKKALFLHKELEKIAPGLSRGVREHPFVYNQDVHPGALLIEVGGHKNSLEEARRALPFLARALAELYNN